MTSWPTGHGSSETRRRSRAAAWSQTHVAKVGVPGEPRVPQRHACEVLRDRGLEVEQGVRDVRTSPMRPSGCRLPRKSWVLGSCIGVLMTPGATALTRMPRFEAPTGLSTTKTADDCGGGDDVDVAELTGSYRIPRKRDRTRRRRGYRATFRSCDAHAQIFGESVGPIQCPTMSNSLFKLARLVLLTGLAAATMGLASADDAIRSSTSALRPSAVFVQIGDGSRTRTVTAGLAWDLPWGWRLAKGELSAYLDASVGRWWVNEDGMVHSPWVTQLGLTPVLRCRWGEERRWWFAELGVGIDVLTPIFNDEDRRFSTAFNFGDHLALGRTFGDDAREEIALRVQPYSNGGIKQPNPGINFVQMRYTRRFDDLPRAAGIAGCARGGSAAPKWTRM